MRRACLGKTSLEVSRVVLGSMGHRATTAQERARVLDVAIDHGMTTIDTAPLYGFGGVESELGGLLAGRRDRVELLSKVGLRWDDEHGEILFSFHDKSGRHTSVRRDSRPEAIRRDVEESLTRLRTDVLDLCQIHHPDRRTPIADAVGTLEDLVSEGKIRHLGVSNFAGPEIEAAIEGLSRVPLASDQLEYNLLKRTADREILPLARQHGFSLLAYSPLDAGSLAGKLLAAQANIEDGRRDRATFQGRNASAINDVLTRCVQPIAQELDASLAQICLAWIIRRSEFAAVVVGASSETQVVSNAGAAAIGLDESQWNALGEAFTGLSLRPASGAGIVRRTRSFLGRVRRRLWG